MLRLQILQLLHQLVELGVADLGLVENVIKIFVVPDLLAQRFDLLFGVFAGGNHRANYSRGQQKGPANASPLGPNSPSHQTIHSQRLSPTLPPRVKLLLDKSRVIRTLLLQQGLM